MIEHVFIGPRFPSNFREEGMEVSVTVSAFYPGADLLSKDPYDVPLQRWSFVLDVNRRAAPVVDLRSTANVLFRGVFDQLMLMPLNLVLGEKGENCPKLRCVVKTRKDNTVRVRPVAYGVKQNVAKIVCSEGSITVDVTFCNREFDKWEKYAGIIPPLQPVITSRPPTMGKRQVQRKVNHRMVDPILLKKYSSAGASGSPPKPTGASGTPPKPTDDLGTIRRVGASVDTKSAKKLDQAEWYMIISNLNYSFT